MVLYTGSGIYSLKHMILTICYLKILQIRLAEAQLQGDQQNLKQEQLEKVKKIEGWREELKLLEEQKAMTLPSQTC